MKIVETNRLYLKEFHVSDADKMFLLNADPEVIKFTGDRAFNNLEETIELIQNYDHYKIYGFGRWSVFLKDTNKYIGWCGLKYTKEKDEFDIGFRFFKEQWNKGYATESASACLELGFTKFKMNKIIGRAMSANIGSIKVLEKIGLKFEKKFDFDGAEGVIYSIEK